MKIFHYINPVQKGDVNTSLLPEDFNIQCKFKDYITRDRFNKKETSLLYKVTMWLTKPYTGHYIHVTSNNTQILLESLKKKTEHISDRYIKRLRQPGRDL